MRGFSRQAELLQDPMYTGRRSHDRDDLHPALALGALKHIHQKYPLQQRGPGEAATPGNVARIDLARFVDRGRAANFHGPGPRYHLIAILGGRTEDAVVASPVGTGTVLAPTRPRTIPADSELEDPRRVSQPSRVGPRRAKRGGSPRGYAASLSPPATGAGAPSRAFSALRRAISLSRSSSASTGCSVMYWQALSRPWAMRSPFQA